MMVTDGMFTYSALGTLAGASLLTYLITAALKGKLGAWIQPQNLAVIIGSLTLGTAQIAQGAGYADWRLYPLALANGFLVAIAAGKVHDIAQPGDEGVPVVPPVVPPVPPVVVAPSAPLVDANGQTILPPA